MEEIKKPMQESNEEPITKKQFDSLWLWCEMIASVLEQDGQTLNKYITLPIHPTKESIKIAFIKPTMLDMFGKTSTKQLDKKKEIDQIVSVLTEAFATQGIELPPFPHDKTNEQNFIETYN